MTKYKLKVLEKIVQLKHGQNKKGQKIFQLLLNTFYTWQLRKSNQKTVQLDYFLAPLIL